VSSVFAIALRGDKAKPPLIQAKKNERVLPRWTSDVETHAHRHGDHIEITIGPDRRADMVFNAYGMGRFTIEAHHPAGPSS
jgi:hypothetical protein